MGAATERNLLRNGELSRRVGVSEHLLRAWESRYGLLQPVRSRGGFRLYSEADESRIRTIQAELTELARRFPLALAGAGATAQLADAAGARLMAGDPVTEAERAGWPR
jgi:MerR family transcriptional regulator, light-induced transcriptional regulator